MVTDLKPVRGFFFNGGLCGSNAGEHFVFSGDATLNFALTAVRSRNVDFNKRLIRVDRKNVLQQVGAEVVRLKPAAYPIRIKQTNGFHSPDRVKKSVE